MGRGKKYYSKDKERFRQALITNNKKYKGKDVLKDEKTSAEKAITNIEDNKKVKELAKSSLPPKNYFKFIDKYTKESKNKNYYMFSENNEDGEDKEKSKMILDMLNSNSRSEAQEKIFKRHIINKKSIKEQNQQIEKFNNLKKKYGNIIIKNGEVDKESSIDLFSNLDNFDQFEFSSIEEANRVCDQFEGNYKCFLKMGYDLPYPEYYLLNNIFDGKIVGFFSKKYLEEAFKINDFILKNKNNNL